MIPTSSIKETSDEKVDPSQRPGDEPVAGGSHGGQRQAGLHPEPEPVVQSGPVTVAHSLGYLNGQPITYTLAHPNGETDSEPVISTVVEANPAGD